MQIFHLFWLTTFTFLALTTNSQAENTWAQKRFIEGRWGAEAGDGFVFILTTSADLECSFDRWLDSDKDEYPCAIKETDASDSLVAEGAKEYGWSQVEAYEISLGPDAQAVLQAFIYDHPTEGSILWLEEDGEDVFEDVWRKLPNPRVMVRSGIGVDPNLSRRQRQCIIDVIDEKVSDDVLDLIFDIYPDRFEDDWDVFAEAIGFGMYLDEVCEVDPKELDWG